MQPISQEESNSPFPKWGFVYLAITALVLVFGFYKAMTAPMEATMGNLQRVFYYHLPHAILSFIPPYLNCIASLAYLFWRNRNPPRAAAADAFALASAEVTVLYATIGLATGMLWGRAAWGIWWAWDARLTTYLLLWLLYVSYLLLRRFSATGQTAIVSAVLAIFAAIDIPICFMSIRWWRTQHPAPVFGGGSDSGIDPTMVPALLWNMTAWFLWGAFVLGVRYAVERRRQRQANARALSFMMDEAFEAPAVLEVR
jgi:heme exporter protein C